MIWSYSFSYPLLSAHTSSIRWIRSVRLACWTHFSTTLEANLCWDRARILPRTAPIIRVLSSCKTNKQSIKKFFQESFHKNQRGRLRYIAQCIGRIMYYVNKKRLHIFSAWKKILSKWENYLDTTMDFFEWPHFVGI